MTKDGSRSRRFKTFAERHPFCCYCGGVEVIEQIDHLPPRILFTGKRRSSGLELPACASCNQGTRYIDEVAALFSYLQSHLSEEHEQADFQKILRSILDRDPSLLAELLPKRRQKARFERRGYSREGVAGPLNLSFRVAEHVEKFTVKLGLGLHYHYTGIIVPKSGGVVAQWYSNADRIIGSYPMSVVNKFEFHQTLKQGKWQVHEQFTCSPRITNDNRAGMYFCTFRHSFASISFVCIDKSDIQSLPFMRIHEPGDWAIRAWSTLRQ